MKILFKVFGKIIGILLLSFFIGCVSAPSKPVSLLEESPQILFVGPDVTQKLSLQPQWSIVFSQPMDVSTVNEASVILYEGKIDAGTYDTPLALYKDMDQKKAAQISLQFFWDPEGRVLTLAAQEELSPNQSYSLLITSKALSSERLSLKPMDLALKPMDVPLLRFYQTAELAVGNSTPSVSKATPVTPGSKKPTPEVPIKPVSSGPSPAIPSPSAPSQSSPQGTPQGSSQNPPEEESLVAGTVVINEIYYDAVGSDTDGVLFVELFGTPHFKVGGYKVVFVNGGDGKITDSVVLPVSAEIPVDGFYVIADAKTGVPNASRVEGADLVDNFDPQNGPDAVQLLDDQGKLVDAVAYGAGVVKMAENGLPLFEGKEGPLVKSGHSLERKSPGLDSNNNFDDFMERDTPTPRN